MYEEYEIQTTETDREITLHRMYDEVWEDVELQYEEYKDDSLLVQYRKAYNG